MITMSTRGRLNIAAIVGQQKVSVNDLHVLGDLFKKVSLPDEVRETIMRDIGNGQAILDIEAMKAHPDAEIDLEKAESRKLKQILKDWQQYGPADLEWLDPVLKQLEEPAAATPN
jgi:hypothetical protein